LFLHHCNCDFDRYNLGRADVRSASTLIGIHQDPYCLRSCLWWGNTTCRSLRMFKIRHDPIAPHVSFPSAADDESVDYLELVPLSNRVTTKLPYRPEVTEQGSRTIWISLRTMPSRLRSESIQRKLRKVVCAGLALSVLVEAGKVIPPYRPSKAEVSSSAPASIPTYFRTHRVVFPS
jgi:hypothetical protein